MNQDATGDGKYLTPLNSSNLLPDGMIIGAFKPCAYYSPGMRMVECHLANGGNFIDTLPWCIPNIFETMSDGRGEIVGLHIFLDQTIPRHNQKLQDLLAELDGLLGGYCQSCISKMDPNIWNRFKNMEIQVA